MNVWFNFKHFNNSPSFPSLNHVQNQKYWPAVPKRFIIILLYYYLTFYSFSSDPSFNKTVPQEIFQFYERTPAIYYHTHTHSHMHNKANQHTKQEAHN